jgi:hypothetical protein
MNQVKTGWGDIASHMCPVSCEQIHGRLHALGRGSHADGALDPALPWVHTHRQDHGGIAAIPALS